MLLLLFIVFILTTTLLLLSSPVRSGPTNSHSHSRKSHSHKSHSHESKSHKSHSHKSQSHNSPSQSQSQSQSYGNCNETSVTRLPGPEPNLHTNSSFPMWPLVVDVTLSGSGKTGQPEAWIYVYYNYTHFHIKNPDKVKNCDVSPDLSAIPYVIATETYIIRNFDSGDCNTVCAIGFELALNCPLVDLSGKYNLHIPHIGSYEINIDVCTNDGVDYGPSCEAIPSQCRQTSPFLPSPVNCHKKNNDNGLNTADKVGISFGVIGGVMLIVIIILVILYVQAQAYVDRSKRGGGPLSL